MTGRWWMMVALLCVGLAGCHKESQTAEAKDEHSEEEKAHVAVRVEAARRGTIVQTVEALGRSEAIPAKLAMLTPAVEGHVHELVVKQGETVQKGQPIVELDQSVALADLAEKTATRDSLRAALALLKSIPRPEERRSNELAVEQAKVALERAKAAAERLRPLFARHEVSEQQVFEADLAATSARLALQTAEAQLHAMLIGPRPEAVAEAEAKITVADGLVAFSKAHLDLHTIRADRRGPRQPHLPSRPDDRDRHTDRRSRRYPASLHLCLPPSAIGSGGPRWAEGSGQDRRVASEALRRAGQR